MARGVRHPGCRRALASWRASGGATLHWQSTQPLMSRHLSRCLGTSSSMKLRSAASLSECRTVRPRSSARVSACPSRRLRPRRTEAGKGGIQRHGAISTCRQATPAGGMLAKSTPPPGRRGRGRLRPQCSARQAHALRAQPSPGLGSVNTHADPAFASQRPPGPH